MTRVLCEVWDEITYPFPNFTSLWMDMQIHPHFIMDVITYPCLYESQSLLIERINKFIGPWYMCL